VPGGTRVRRVYSEEQLFYGVVRMVTPKKKPRRKKLPPVLTTAS
jgi:hypothetical protein